MEIRWSPQAASDLRAIKDYIARDSPHYAEITINRIIDAAMSLEEFPRLGRVVPERSDDSIREIVVQNYRVIYLLDPDVVEILTVHHGARRLDPRRL